MNRLPPPLYASFVLGMNVLAFSLLAWSGWSVYQGYRTGFTATAQSQTSPVKPAQSVPEVQLSMIVDHHLFGENTRPAKRSVPVSKPAPETQLQLSLLGVIASKQKNLAHAIIAVKGGRASSYVIGGTINGTNVRIREIKDKKVILYRRGVLESLTLEKNSLTNAPPLTGLLAHPAQTTALPLSLSPSDALPLATSVYPETGFTPNRAAVKIRPSELRKYMINPLRM